MFQPFYLGSPVIWGTLPPCKQALRILSVYIETLTMPFQEPPKKKSKQVELNKQGILLSWVKPCTSDPEPGVLEETIRIKEQTEMRMNWSHRQQ